jgi:Zn-dependent protease
MDLNPKILVDGAISYLCFLIVLAFHECGHAWMAWKRGDDTARLLGRVSLNPIVHIEFFGTILLPLLGILLSAAGSGAAKFVIGWGKPVPVNPANFKNRRLDNMLVGISGPFMNIVIAFGAIALVHLGNVLHSNLLIELCFRIAIISLFLCFFNLLPIPPLDGSHVASYILGWSDETYHNIARFGSIIIIIVIQIPAVMQLLSFLTRFTLGIIQTVLRVY